MDSKGLSYKLKEFYLLEVLQVKYYTAMLSETQDEYYHRAFKKMVKTEKGHADYFARKMKAEGVDPPQVIEPLFKMAGRFLGEAAELTGPYNTCRLGVALESKASEMYRDFIVKGWGEQELRDTLMDHLLDEEYHALWMRDYMRHL